MAVFGEMAEWSNALASKASDPQGFGGSNPPLSEILNEKVGFEGSAPLTKVSEKRRVVAASGARVPDP